MIRTKISGLCGCAILVCLPFTLHGQQSTASPVVSPNSPEEAFMVVLGHQGPGASDSGTDYTVLATQLLDSKLTGQKIQFVVDQSRKDGRSTHRLTSNTGKYKTVGQLRALLADVFRHFLAGPTAPNQEFGKIGAVRFGGEIHFVADSADSLRYDIVTPAGPDPGSGQFSRVDVQSFLSLM